MARRGHNINVFAYESGRQVLRLVRRTHESDPHVPLDGRNLIRARLEEVGANFQWHEVNGQPALLRDDRPRHDPALAYHCYGLVFERGHFDLPLGQTERALQINPSDAESLRHEAGSWFGRAEPRRPCLGLRAHFALIPTIPERPFIWELPITSLAGMARPSKLWIAEMQDKREQNSIDYNIVPYTQMRQKIVSAMTSGVVLDLFQNTPAEIIGLYAWQDKLVDVSDGCFATLSAYLQPGH